MPGLVWDACCGGCGMPVGVGVGRVLWWGGVKWWRRSLSVWGEGGGGRHGNWTLVVRNGTVGTAVRVHREDGIHERCAGHSQASPAECGSQGAVIHLRPPTSPIPLLIYCVTFYNGNEAAGAIRLNMFA